MKKNALTRASSALVLLGSGVLLGTGNCMPDNFWVDAWGRTLNDGMDMAAETFVWDNLEAALAPEDTD